MNLAKIAETVQYHLAPYLNRRNSEGLSQEQLADQAGKSKSPNLAVDALLKGWNPVALPFTRLTDKKHRILVARSRDVILNTTDGKTASRIIRHNVVGDMGVRMQSQVTNKGGDDPDMVVNDAIEKAWEEYGSTPELCDLAEQNTLYDFQIEAMNSIITDGETFLRRNKVDEDYGIKVSVIDPLRIPPGRSSFIRPINKDEVYKNGIIVSKDKNKRLFYAVNPDDVFRYSDRIDDAAFVPAAEVSHAYLKEGFTGQMRGIPMGHTTFVNLYLMEKYIEAAVVNARVSAAKLGWLSKAQGADENLKQPQVEFEVDENGDIVYDEDGNPVPLDPFDKDVEISTEAGSINWLPDGYQFTGWDTDYPHEQFDSFTRVANRKTASGFAVPYADMTGDLSDVNYSSIRQGSLEIRENYKMLQKIIIWLMDQIYAEWLMYALMREMIVVRGRPLSVMDYDDYYKPRWVPRRWPWIDPQSEARANQIAAQTGIKSLSQIIRELGGDPAETWKSIKQDIDQMQKHGVPDNIIAAIFAQKGATAEEIIDAIKGA